MARITRIKAGEGPREEDDGKPAKRKKVMAREEKAKNGKKSFGLFRPFVALGQYLKGSWHELRQVRWPNRKTTWKMFLAVIVYSLIFVVVISVLDLIFGGLSNLILKR